MPEDERIPRIIHYCWFGRGSKSRKIRHCLKSWKKYMPDYQVFEWNEDTFDMGMNAFVKEAYDAKKYAFVSDYVRLYALYHHGGIYMDTDVEVIRPLDRFLNHEVFSGFEDEVYLQSGTMGAVAQHSWIGELLEYYHGRRFKLADGQLDMTTNTSIMSRITASQGLQLNGQYQVLDNGVTFYPRTYFSPYDYINGASYITDDSYTIHHFSKSWLPRHVRVRSHLKKLIGRYIGPQFVAKMRVLLKTDHKKNVKR